MQRAAAGEVGEVPFRGEMEAAFGVNLGGVAAYAGADGLGAPAAAEGSTIAFSDPAPSRKMVAHEVAHVLQAGNHGAGDAESEADRAGMRVADGGKAGPMRSGAGGVHHWEPGDAHDDGSRHWARMAGAATESLDGILTDVEDEVTDAAREEIPGIVGPLAARLHPQLAHMEGVLGHVNTLVETGEHVHDAMELIAAVRTFDAAFRSSGSGAPTAIRESGAALAGLCDSAGALLDLLPDELGFLKIPVMTMLRVAGRMGRVGANVFADYFDRLNGIAYEGRASARGIGAPLYDTQQLHRFAMELGPRFISDIADTEERASVQSSMVADAGALVQKMQDKVEPGFFADYLGGEDPFYEGTEQVEALAVLIDVKADLLAKAGECSGEIVMANRFRVLTSGATAALDDPCQYGAMLAILNRRVGSAHHVAGHLLNRGTVGGLASPTDIGYRL
jgi:hypothetical protein